MTKQCDAKLLSDLDGEIRRKHTQRTKAKVLQLWDVLLQHNLHIQLAKWECLNDPFTHEHFHCILQESKTKSTNLLWHCTIALAHVCSSHVLIFRAQVVVYQGLNLPQHFHWKPTHTVMKYQRDDINTGFTMRVCLERDKCVQLQYLSLPFTLFTKNDVIPNVSQRVYQVVSPYSYASYSPNQKPP